MEVKKLRLEGFVYMVTKVVKTTERGGTFLFKGYCPGCYAAVELPPSSLVTENTPETGLESSFMTSALFQGIYGSHLF